MLSSRDSTPTETRPGDVVEVFGHRVGDAARSGEILEVSGPRAIRITESGGRMGGYRFCTPERMCS
jgi:hypothetical protein